MHSRSQRPTTAVLFAGLTLVGAVSSCSTPDSRSDASGGNSTSAGNHNYVDGTYTETGGYVSPNGPETVEVTLSIEANIVTDVTVVGHGESPSTKQFQRQFISGIASEIVGKNIDELSVDKVSGSSLTSGGFAQALEEIKADALAE